MGLLNGPAFNFTFALFSFLFMKLPDYIGKKFSFFASAFLVGLCTFLTSFCTQFWHLLICRAGTAIASAVISSVPITLLSDYFPPQARGRAIAVYSMGIYVGMGITSALGAAIDVETTNYKQVFFYLGLPQVALSLLALLTVKEKKRVHEEKYGTPLIQTLKYMKSRWSFWCIMVAAGMTMLAGQCWAMW
jgi:MFS family permease